MAREELSPYDESPPESVAEEAIEPGERIIWAGRPDVEALTSEARRQRGLGGFVKGLARPLAILLFAALVWAYMNGLDLASAMDLLSAAVRNAGAEGVVAPLAFLGFVGLILALQARTAGKFIEWARGLTYAITDRRLLILLDGEIETELEPGQVKKMRLRNRTEGFQDLVFAEKLRGGSSGKGSLTAREKRRIGFKALPDAERIQELVERWREAHLASAERSLEDFLAEEDVSSARATPASEGGVSGEGESDAPWSSVDALEEPSVAGSDRPADHGSPSSAEGFSGEGGVRTLGGGRYDLTVRFPEEWSVKVRRRRKPFGTVFLDTLSWGPADEIDDWNVAKVEGPFQTTVEVHVDAVPEPAGTYEEALDSTLNRWATGEVVSSDPDVRRGRFHGWSVTRRHQKGVMAEGAELDRVGFFRTTYLHDGVIQLAFVSHWPGGSDGLREAVERIESNVTVRSEGVVPEPPDAVASAASSAVGFAGGVAGRMLRASRVVVGLLIFAVGVWAGYDQTTRAESYEGALAELVAAAEEGLPSLPSDTVVGTWDGRLAHLQGSLRPPTATDTVTGLTVTGWRLARTVELHQWQERRSDDGGTSYSRIWSSSLIDSDDFRRGPDGAQTYANPSRKPWRDTSFLAEEMGIGAWRLSTYAYGRSDREPVPPSMLRDASLNEGWTARGEYLYREDDPDVRVRYVYHPMEGGPHSVIGVPEDGILTLDDDLAQAPLLVAGTVSADSIVAGAAGTERDVQSVWMIWAWLGLMIMLRPVARPFALFDRFTKAPFLRRQLMGGAVSAVVVLALAIVLY